MSVLYFFVWVCHFICNSMCAIFVWVPTYGPCASMLPYGPLLHRPGIVLCLPLPLSPPPKSCTFMVCIGRPALLTLLHVKPCRSCTCSQQPVCCDPLG
eukprot:190801-Pleurochrysis_carterae.AAC.1